MKQLILSFLLMFFAVIAFAQSKETLTINFDFNKYDLTAEATAKLDGFVNKISQLEISAIRLSGYCDSKGSNKYNDALSLRRVNAVKQYLENNKNIKAGSYFEKGFGENGLLNSDLTEEEGYQNRRVEIVAMIKDQPVKKEEPVAEVKQETKSLTVMMADTAVKKGAVISLPNLQFENNSPVLLRSSMPTLQELFDILVKNPKLTISIEGHICCVPPVPGKSPEELPSFDISVSRAKMVWSYLIEKGIDPGRLSYKGFGNGHPIYPIPEKNEEEVIANRRVEIRILEK